MTGTDYLGFAAVGGILAGIWGHIKSIWAVIRSSVVTKVLIDENTMIGLLPKLSEKYKSIRLGNRKIMSRVEFVRPVKNSQFVAFDMLGKTPTIFFDRWKPLSICSESNDHSIGSIYSLVFIRGTFGIENLVKLGIDNRNNRLEENSKSINSNRFNIYTRSGDLGKPIDFGRRGVNGGTGSEAPSVESSKSDSEINLLEPLFWKREDIGYEVQANPFSAYDIEDNVANAIEDAKKWYESKEWYTEKEIPWRRGWLLFGPPGTGKSKLSSCIAQKLGIPIYVFDIATMTNDNFTENWKDAVGCSPAIVLLEDFDSVFEGRKNKIPGGVTFDCILNSIGGVKDSNGIFTIITTNHIENIDAALGIETDKGSSRPGRMDKVIRLGNMSEKCRRTMAGRICRDCPDVIDDLVSSSIDFTAAQFQEKCTQIALDKHWSKLHPKL